MAPSIPWRQVITRNVKICLTISHIWRGVLYNSRRTSATVSCRCHNRSSDACVYRVVVLCANQFAYHPDLPAVNTECSFLIFMCAPVVCQRLILFADLSLTGFISSCRWLLSMKPFCLWNISFSLDWHLRSLNTVRSFLRWHRETATWFRTNWNTIINKFVFWGLFFLRGL